MSMTKERLEEIRSLRGQVKECGEWRFCFDEERGGRGVVYAGFYCVAEPDDDGNGRFIAGAPKAVDDLLDRVAELEAAIRKHRDSGPPCEVQLACDRELWRTIDGTGN